MLRGLELGFDDDVDAAIALAALLGVVIGDRLRLAVADRAQAERRHGKLVREVRAHGLGAPPRQREIVLVAALEDFVDFDNYFRGSTGLNAHEAYGYLAQRIVGEVIGDWLERLP